MIDVAGEHQMNILKSVNKIRLDPLGIPLINQSLGEDASSDIISESVPISVNACGSCYAATQLDPNSPLGISCCNTCDDVINAYKKFGIPLPPLTTFEQVTFKTTLNLVSSRPRVF